MKKIEIKRKKILKKIDEKELLAKIVVNSSGFVMYPGEESESMRTGSPARMLIDYYLNKKGPKPIDFYIFKDFVEGKINRV